MFKRIGLLLLLTLSLWVSPSLQVQAQTGLHAHGGIFLGDNTEFFFGGGIAFPVAFGETEFIANPSVDYFPFFDDATFLIVNADAMYPLATLGESANLALGAGLGFQYFSVDLPEGTPDVLDSSDIDLALNLFADVTFGEEGLVPFGRGRLSLGGDAVFSILGGVRIQFGGN